MLNKRERIMVNILLWFSILVLIALYVFLTGEKYYELHTEIGKMEKQIQNFKSKIPSRTSLSSQKESLTTEINSEIQRLYLTDETDTYEFGDTIRELLVKEKLLISRYQTIEISEKIYHEFSVSGDKRAFFSFLRAVSQSTKYWTIPSLTVNTIDSDTVNVVFRITYETIA